MCKDNYANFKNMSGRGDNNKAGSAGRGASNQSTRGSDNQPIVENPIMANEQVENHLYPRRKRADNLPIEIQV